MAYTSRDRDRARLAVVGVTGLGAVGALTATGWLAGVTAAEVTSPEPASSGASPSTPQARPQHDLRERPYVTRVTLRYVPAAVAVPVSPASGGTVTDVSPGSSGTSTSSGQSGPSSDSSGSSSSSGSSAPPPAPSSGS